MTPSDLRYPIICLARDGFETRKEAAELVLTFQPLLRNGWFQNLEIIDSSGAKFRVTNVKGLGGVGPFWGYSLFFNRKIRVELTIELIDENASLLEIRQLVLKDFKDWHGWESRGDFDELKSSVEKAQTIGDIIRLIA